MRLALSILLLCSSLNAQWVNGYYTANNGVQTPSQLPWSKYTAIIHFAARAGVNGSGVGNGTVNTSELTDTAALIASRPAGKKVLLSLADNGSFPMAFAQDAAAGLRSTFVTNITNTVASNGYDGVELDWEGNINTSDYTALIAALRVAMPTKTITIAVFTGPPTAVAAAAQANLDEVNVECYDLGNFTAYSWYNNPIFAPTFGFSSSCYDEMFQSGSNNGAVTAGVARAKIGVGIPFYGYRWTGCTVAQITPCTRGAFTPYRTLASDGTRFIPANQQYDNTYKAQYLSISGLNEFDPYTGTQQIADIVTWAKSQGFGGYYSFTTEYEYMASQAGDAKYPLSTALYASVFAGFPVDSNGWIITGLPNTQDNLLGPLIPYGNSPWIYGDLANKGTVDYMVPIALAEAPALGAALAGTFSFSGGNTLTTTVNQTGPLAGEQYITCAWSSVDGAGTGRMIVPISSVTSTTVVASENFSVPSFSGVTCYKMSLTPDTYGCNFTCWTTENPNTVWNYYDVAIGLYRLYYRTGNVQYQTWARQFADIQWQWVLDHGYRTVSPRAGAFVSQFFRAGESHSERLPGLYNWLTLIVPSWATNTDLRESGYTLWDVALGAKVDPNPTRHAQYCSWLTTYTANPWIANQNTDGSWSENEFQLNASYVSAPKAFAPPFQYQAAPWREAINIKSLEAAYESLNDTATQGCNSPTLAAQTLTSVTRAVTWQNNYGRDSGNRGDYYEVNSQSNDQASVSPATGTVSTTVSSTAIVGVATNWNTAGYCDGTHFIGFFTPRTVYKIASCSDNTHATLSVAFGLYGEVSNVSGDQFGIAPAASTSCNSSATYCYTGSGDRNLTRTNCGGIGWLYAQTLNTTYLGWLNECYSATLGGPTAGLTSAANLGSVTLPCSGPACDGLVTDVVASAANCNTSPTPCLFGVAFGNLGKNYGEAFGAPGIDNTLAWRLLSGPITPVAPTITSSSPLPGGTVGTPYSFQFTAAGTTPITWSATGMPSWASITTGGLLTGTPNAAATTSFPVTATNTAGSNSKTFSVTIVATGVAPTITSTSPLPNGATGVPYSYQFLGNGTAPIAWSATGLPGWASLSSGGLLSGTPNAAAVSTISVTALNAFGSAGPTPFSLTVTTTPTTPTCSPKTHVTPPTVTDIQLQSNMALGVTACTNSLTQTGTCTVVDVQRVVNASLGGACVIGP